VLRFLARVCAKQIEARRGWALCDGIVQSKNTSCFTGERPRQTLYACLSRPEKNLEEIRRQSNKKNASDKSLHKL